MICLFVILSILYIDDREICTMLFTHILACLWSLCGGGRGWVVFGAGVFVAFGAFALELPRGGMAPYA